MAARDTLVAMATLPDDEASVGALVDAVVAAVERHRGPPRQVVPATAWVVDPETVMSPREAFFAPHAVVPTDQAVGRVCVELVAPYPPGIPVLAPGERLTAEVVHALHQARAAGTRVAYAADPSLKTFRVVC